MPGRFLVDPSATPVSKWCGEASCETGVAGLRACAVARLAMYSAIHTID